MFTDDRVSSGAADQDGMSAFDILPPELGVFNDINEIEAVNVNQTAFDEGSAFLHQAFPVVSDLEQYESESVS